MENDKKLEKLLKRQELLQERIKTDSEELKSIQTEIKLLSYDRLNDELNGLGLDFGEISVLAKMRAKMEQAGVTYADFDELLDSLSSDTSKNSETEDEKK